MKKIKLKDDYLYQLFDLLEKSYSLKEISIELGITYGHLRRIMSGFYASYGVTNVCGLVAKKDQVILENTPKKSELD